MQGTLSIDKKLGYVNILLENEKGIKWQNLEI